MILQFMKNTVADRLDHIEKHLIEARRQLGIVSSGDSLTDKMNACLNLGTEVEVIRGDAHAILAVIGDKGENADAMQNMAPVVEELEKLRRLSKGARKCPDGRGFGKFVGILPQCSSCPEYDECNKVFIGE